MAQNQHTERSWWAADNESMRPYYGRPHKFQVQMLKDRDNRPVNSCYLLRDRQTQPSPTSSRLDAIQNSNPPPRTRTELFERAGATFFQHWHQSEEIRHFRSPCMTTEIAFNNIANTPENLRLAEEQLNLNTLGLEEGQVAEERKTLQWLRDGAPLEYQAEDDPVVLTLDAGAGPNAENSA